MQPPMFSYILAPLIYSFIKILCDNAEVYQSSDIMSDKFKATYYDKEDTFDFIVVGAGSAGNVVVNVLVQNGFKVLLLEAGGEEQPAQKIPSTSLLLMGKPQLDWLHKTVPQTHSCFALNNRESTWNAGRGLGGTSSLNFLQYLRGHPKDFEAWANITGDSSWNYESVTKHFQAIEDFKGEFGNHESHGHGGPLTVQPPPFKGMAEYFLKAGEEKGFKITDLNGPHDEGFSIIYNNIKNGRRHSTYNAFLHPIRDNPLLTIYKFSEVTKILIGGEKNEAYGVEYVRHGEMIKSAFAIKEVLISAGTVNSAKLLQISGIGPKKQLDSLGIKTIIDSPTGQQLQDHPTVYLGPFFINKPVSMILDRDVNSETLTEFIEQGTGPVASTGTLATALISSSFAKAAGEANWPDIQFILVGTGVYSKFAQDFASAFNVKQDLLKKYLRNAKGKDSFQIIVGLNRPIQRGEIILKSSNPKDAPLIDPKYYHNDQDVEVMVEAIKRAIDLVENTTIFNSIGARFTTEKFPGCEDLEFRSDDYWRCFTRHYTITNHHFVASCSMGRTNSKNAVVDSKLRVIGAKNLRVVDASIMPLNVNVNTAAATMMIGHKAATEIVKFWKSN